MVETSGEKPQKNPQLTKVPGMAFGVTGIIATSSTLSQGHHLSRGFQEGPSWRQGQLPLDPTISKLNQPLPATREKKKQIKQTRCVGNIWAISCMFNTFSIKPMTNGKGSRRSHKGSLLPQAEGAAGREGKVSRLNRQMGGERVIHSRSTI